MSLNEQPITVIFTNPVTGVAGSHGTSGTSGLSGTSVSVGKLMVGGEWKAM